MNSSRNGARTLAELKPLIEESVHELLAQEVYEYERINAQRLLSWNRLDLAFKLFYLDCVEQNSALAARVYREDIRSQTLGQYVEPGNVTKDSFDKYTDVFSDVYSSIKAGGFDGETTLVPVAHDCSIINGAHRVASAIHLDQSVICLRTELPPRMCDYRYFLNRAVPAEIVEPVVNTFIKYADNVYLAFLWPAMGRGQGEAEKQFERVVFKKSIKLTPRGAYNLIAQLYMGMEWMGTVEQGFPGAKTKLLQCFPDFGSFKVIAFQADSLGEVQELKEKIRALFDLGFSSVHITDTKEEALRISELVFNANGLHFLNYGQPYRYRSLHQGLSSFRDHLRNNNIAVSSVVIDGSSVLSLYGIRQNEDIDYLTLDTGNQAASNEAFETHNSELAYHGQSVENLVLDPSLHFVFTGLKFVSFRQLYEMKARRDETKDNIDCKLMAAYTDGNSSYRSSLLKFRQLLFYHQIRIFRFMRKRGVAMLKKVGLYDLALQIYLRVTGT